MIISHFKESYHNWKVFLKDKKNLFTFVVILIILIIVLSIFSNFLAFAESRQGVIIDDPILELFSPIDLTIPLFFMMYVLVIIAIANLMKHPRHLAFSFLAYSLMLLFRMSAMYTIPLDPPPSMIILKDPIVEAFSTGVPLTRDLFFSGHTATTFLIFLIVQGRGLKIIAFFIFFFTAIAVLLQHVHYTVDVLAAPFFTFCSYWIAEYFRRILMKG